MGSKSTELAEEQAYFDAVAEHRERHRAALDEIPGAAANPGASARIRQFIRGKKADHARQPEAVAFGRIDDQAQERLYIGNQSITDENRDVLVVNWKTPAAAP